MSISHANDPHIERSENPEATGRPGGVGLFLVTAAVIAFTWFAAVMLPASSPPNHSDPVTGHEFAEFLVANESRLRTSLGNYDETLAGAREAGDRSMIEWLRETYGDEE